MSLEHSPTGEPLKVRSLRETANLAGVSLDTLRRRIADGTGPVVTRVSPRRCGIRVDHFQAWLDACAEKAA